MRGEYLLFSQCCRPERELPPRARRIPPRTDMNGLPPGTTSACAENTNTSAKSACGKWNYLRVRGEYREKTRKPVEFVGTTSACAENTQKTAYDYKDAGNYLRVRGEYLRTSFRVFCTVELPPRARRIQSSTISGRISSGTTSACAENTHRPAKMQDRAGNYLRVRGEYPQTCYETTAFEELPPRARRIRCGHGLCHAEGGTTSACAENTARQKLTPQG